MHEAVVIFNHYKNDTPTRRHLDLLRQHNRFPVIPVYHAEEHVEDAVDVGGPLTNRWARSDHFLLNWFLRRPFDAERYINLDWDCYVSIPLKEFYGDLWDSIATIPSFFMRRDRPRWHWFREPLPQELRPFAAGAAVLNGMLLSHRAMQKLADMPQPDNFAELRVGTLLNAAGIPVTVWPHAMRRNNSWRPSHIAFTPEIPGFYHPVKE